MHGIFQGRYFLLDNRYEIVILGSEIPEWFRHQSIGDEVSIQEPNSILCNEWMGIAVCIVFCNLPRHQIHKNVFLCCWLMANGKKISSAPCIGKIKHMNVMQLDSNHIWLIYLLPQYYNEEDVKPVWECDANGLSQIGVRIESRRGFKVQKCGLQLVYKKDIEDLNQQFDGGMES